ncbi:hypothetical protein [Plantactinospora sp. DSM 117369]
MTKRSSLRNRATICGVVTALATSLALLGAAPARADGGADESRRAPAPVAAADACTVTNISTDILYVHAQPSTSSAAWGYLWPGPGSGSSAPCYGGFFQGAVGTPHTLCGGGDFYAAVYFFGVLGWVPYSCISVS